MNKAAHDIDDPAPNRGTCTTCNNNDKQYLLNLLHMQFNRRRYTLIEFSADNSSARISCINEQPRSHFGWQMFAALYSTTAFVISIRFPNARRNAIHFVAEDKAAMAVVHSETEINWHRFRNFAEMWISTTYTVPICLLYSSGMVGGAVGAISYHSIDPFKEFFFCFVLHYFCCAECTAWTRMTINEINSTVVTTKLVKSSTTLALYLCHVSSNINWCPGPFKRFRIEKNRNEWIYRVMNKSAS